MLIPLGLGLPNSLSAIDTGVVSDLQVREELRKDEDMGVEQRRDMVDLKEREADEAEQRSQERRQEAAEEQRQIDEERQQIIEERRQVEQERAAEAAEAAERRQEPGQPVEARPGQAAAQQEAAGTEPENQTARDEELTRREEELDRRQAEVDEKQEEAQRDQDLAEQRREEAREERESIAQDQQILLNEEPRTESGPGLITAAIESPASPLGRMVRIDSTTGEELGRSALNTVNIRTLYNINGRYFAIAGENRGGAAIRLVEIDPESLEMKTQGADDIHPQSLLWVSGADFYALTAIGGVPYLARFNYQLTRLARSSVAIHPFATVLFQDGFLLTQRQDGSALILDPGTLEEPSYPANGRPGG
jgi:hypothetical protein